MKHKAHLAFDGSRMREGEGYDNTYAPVASWMSIRLLLTLVVAFGWQTQQVDYVSAYTQAPRHVHGVPMWIQSSWWCRQKRRCRETPL